MEKRKLGQSDLLIDPIVFGGNVFGWTIDEKQSFDILDGFTAAGFNCIDTADVYSRWAPGNTGGESETIIGRWLKNKGNRDKTIVLTKVGSDMGDGKKGLKKDYIIRAAEASLRRLQTDYIDLYQTHFDDPETPVDETLEAYQQLIKDGKVRWIGTSNMSVERIEQSLKAHNEKGLPRYETLQPHYNLYARELYESQFAPLAKKHQMGVITYYSLESGFLTGKYRKREDIVKSARGGKMEHYLNDRGLRILDELDEAAHEYSATPAAVALGWLLNQPTVTAPIVSATKLQQLDSFIQATELNLSAETLRALDQASAYV